MTNNDLKKVDELNELADNEEAAVALFLRQVLVPVEGDGAVIFPPTYAAPKGQNQKSHGYNIDELADGTKTAIIDSVGSQANRMEPVFLPAKPGHPENPCAKLVPQINITYGDDKSLSILEVGHRIGDAVVRSTRLRDKVDRVFKDFQDGDAGPLAKLAPTSLVFGVWDSRGTKAKLPRIIQATIRAEDVDVLTRSAQYNPPLDYSELDVFKSTEIEKQEGKPDSQLAKHGFVHIPSVGTHGGIIARGGIHRTITINLVALRRLEGNEEIKLRRYILGLALVAATAPLDGFLRVGCLLTLDSNSPSEWHSVARTGKRDVLKLDDAVALDYAKTVAQDYGVGRDMEEPFQKELAKQESKSKS